MTSQPPLIDSHIHLFPSTALSPLPWNPPTHPLHAQHSMTEYHAATSSPPVAGFVLIEADRATTPTASPTEEDSAWTGPLAELAFMRRLATGQPLPGEGHVPADAALCLGLVPWAPLPLGAAGLERYLARAEEEVGAEVWAKVKGFRYLLQDKPAGTGLGEGFVEGLRVLGRRGYVFDVGVDQHRRGRAQLEELVEVIDRAHDGVEEGEKVVFILSEWVHLGGCWLGVR